MASKKTQYVLLPTEGVIVSEANPQQVQFFLALHRTASSGNKVHSLSTGVGTMPITVIDSIGEKKAKLIEVIPDDLPALRASHPSVRVVPVVYFQRAVMRYRLAAAVGVRITRAKLKTALKSTTITVTVTSATDGKPVAGAMVVAFTDFASRAGAQGTTNARGQVGLALGASTRKVERVYVYPQFGYWPSLQNGITLRTGTHIALQPIDLAYVDCVRHFYSGVSLSLGEGVTVGVIDSGVSTNHADLVVQGGQNTVPGERPQEFGDNGTEGHGTHVAGIIAARGTPPKGIRGVAPRATLRSYRVFPQGGNNASNYAIAKAIDAGATDKCDLLNMSLGGGAPDTVTAEALTAAHNAGVVIFAANGNDDRQPVSFPAANSMCQAVSAMGRKGTFPSGTEPAGSVAAPYGTDKKNFIASFSNIGPETDLTGPGVGVISEVAPVFRTRV
jgi:subtilisin family serine protease